MSYEIYKNSVAELIKFRSISTNTSFSGEINKTVNWLKNYFSENNFESKVWTDPEINPVVFANYHISDKAETVLIYGHYDVQPAKKADGWDNDPFILKENDGRFVARGIIDNKGQFFVHLATILDLIKKRELKYNVKFIIEGNEETGNTRIGEVINQHKSDLQSDFVLISDGQIFGDHPVIEASFRGSFNITLNFKTANNNLHSGEYGGAVPNATHELAKFISSLYDDGNKIRVPGFYEGADKITKQQLENNEILTRGLGKTLAGAGIKSLITENGTDFFTQVGLRPTIQVSTLRGGHLDNGFSNIVPGSAEAKINVRLVSSQNPTHIYKHFETFVKKHTPKYVEWKLSLINPSPAVMVNINSARVLKIRDLLKRVYGTDVVIKYVGGSLPVVNDFKNILGVNPICVPLANEDSNMHGVNENYEIGALRKGLDFSKSLLGT